MDNVVIHNEDYFAPILGEFEQLVLLALVRLGNGAYGATIRREIRDRTLRDVPIGSVYVTLARLERKKMVASSVGMPSRERGGRRRKHYVLHDDGQRALGRAYRAFKAMAGGVERELDEM
jgi:PadR family transcriptional regulator, regulatory protein PadR